MHLRVSTLVLALIVAAPAALAWGGKGQFEPSTKRDTEDKWMWGATDTDTTTGATGKKLYFNAFSVQNTGYGLHGYSMNPNSATLHTELQHWPGQFMAILGVWKDCNRDGMIGNGDNGLYEYSAALLPTNSPCTVKLVPNPYPTDATSHGFIPGHNDGAWVHELLPLGPDRNTPTLADANMFDLNDPGVRVWADWGKPGDPSPRSRCHINFVPEGTHRSTGGLVHYGDCLTAFYVTDTWNSVAPDGTPAGQLSFKDKPREQGQSASRLNQKHPWGETSGSTMVGAFDCSKPATFGPVVVGPANLSLRVSAIRASPSVNPGGSPGGTVNETENAFEDCDRRDSGKYQLAEAVYPEDEGIHNTAGDREANDFPMKYNEGSRPLPVVGATITGPRVGHGLAIDNARAYDSEGFWISGTRVVEDRTPFFDRNTIRDGNPIAKVQYTTAYAYVPPTAVTKFSLSLNPGANQESIYGKDACGATAGVTGALPKNGWECNPMNWIRDCSEHYECLGYVDGTQVPINVYVGQKFNMRDLDCYDQSVGAARAAGAGYGLLTGTRCE